MPPVLAVVGLVSAVATVNAMDRAATAQQAAAEKQQQQQEEAATQARRQAAREAQIVRARTLASAQASGAIGGSSLSGGLSSLSSQLGGALGYQGQMSGLSRDIGKLQSEANRASSEARMFGQFATLEPLAGLL